MKRFTFYAVLVPFATVVLLFALSNRQTVTISLNPFGSDLSGPQMPLFLLIFIVLAVGILIGGLASWLNHGKIRRAARQAKAETERYKLEAERLKTAASGAAEPIPLTVPPPASF